MNGIVVAKEYREAVEAVMEAFLDEENEADEFKKSIEALKRWRRFLIALRIRERLGIYQGDQSTGEKNDIVTESRVESKDIGDFSLAEETKSDGGGGGFIVDDKEGGGGFFVSDGVDHVSFAEEVKSEEDEEILEDPEDEDLGWF